MCQVVLIWSFVFHDTSTTLSKSQFLPTISVWCELTWLGCKALLLFKHYINDTVYQYRFSEKPRLYKQRCCISLKRWDIREKTFKKPCFDFFAWLLVWYKPCLSGDTHCSDVVVSIPVGECCIVPLVPVLKWWLWSWRVRRRMSDHKRGWTCVWKKLNSSIVQMNFLCKSKVGTHSGTTA